VPAPIPNACKLRWSEYGRQRVCASRPEVGARTQFPNYLSQLDPSDPVWQARYYGLNIWTRMKVEEKLHYILLNPVRAGLVDRAVEWRWGSARWYLEHKSVGLLILWLPGMECEDEFNVD